MKALGAVLVLLSGLCLGLREAGELRRREQALLDLKRTLQAFRAGVGFSAQPLSELIRSCRDSVLCMRAAEEDVFPRDPRQALERAGESLFRKPEDLELFRGLVRGLGGSGTEGQLEHLALYSALLETNLASAREEKEKKSRLYVCLGLFGGVVLCLVLL